MADSSTMLTALKGIITSLGEVSTFVWGLFGDFLEMILNNALIAFPVLFAVLAGAVFMVIKIIRKFGVKGKH